MAHAVNRPRPILIHQALHGYSDGHRELASSRKLEPQDQRTMLVLSDIAGSSMSIGENGYLTGYPLVDSGVYALARTWAAPEMPRPGCVWTHTLLIDFPDLAVLDSPHALNALFSKPSIDYVGGYQDAIDLSGVICGGSYFPSVPDLEWCRTIISSLYAHPKSPIVAHHAEAVDIDGATLSIWWQQWPKLRRSFRFCTHTTSDRGFDGAAFDLQLLGATERYFRAEFESAIEAKGEDRGAQWLDLAVADLHSVEKSSFRTFLNRIGSDAMKGREAFLPMCQLYLLLSKRELGTQDINSIFHIYGQNFKGAGKSLRSIITKKLVDNLGVLSAPEFLYLIQNLKTFSAESLARFGASLGAATWRYSPQLFSELLASDLPEGVSSEVFWHGLATSEVLNGIVGIPGLVESFIEHRAEALADPLVWREGTLSTGELRTIISAMSSLDADVFNAIVKAQRPDLVGSFAHRFGGANVLRVLAQIGRQWVYGSFGPWVSPLIKDAPAIAEFLSSTDGIPVNLLVAIAYETQPEYVPNQYGEDPWWIAIRNRADDAVDEHVFAYLTCYLFSRAIGGSTRSPAQLLVLTFESVHVLTADDQVSDQAWRMMSARLPYMMFWASWDKCLRIRAATINKFINDRLPAKAFVDLTKDDNLFEQLVIQASSSWGGRDFLKSVMEEIEATGRKTSRLKRLKKSKL